MIKVYKYAAGSVECLDSVDPAWLAPDSGVTLWVDLDEPTPEEARVLYDVFHFHELSIEDALAEIHQPKIESYGDYLYLVLHGIDFSARQHKFRTKDVDFFLNPKYLVSVHHGLSRSVGRIADACSRNGQVLAEGTPALLHRIVDTMVDNYRPEVEKLAQRLDKLEKEVFERPEPKLVRAILEFKKDVASLRQVVMPERDAVGRLARREFAFHFGADRLQVPRRSRSSHPPVGRSDVLPGPGQQYSRCPPVGGLEPVEHHHEGVDGDLDDLHAPHVHYRALRDEHRAAAFPVWGRSAVLLGIAGRDAVDFRGYAALVPK